MCIKLVERYAVCGCIYYEHQVDPCRLYGQHSVQERTMLVGFACPNHGAQRASYTAPSRSSSSYDSGYHSSGRPSKSSRDSRW